MHERSTVNMREQAIEDQLHILWRTLPFRAGTDLEGTLSDFQFALQDVSVRAVENVVAALRSGLIDDASRDFCPKAPKLADYARAEQRRLDAVNRPKAVGYQPVGHQFKNWQEIHRHRAEELAASGFVCIPNISIDEMVAGSKRRRWKPGTQWFWSISEAWSPS